MSPAEDALLLLRVVERHLGSLRGTLDPAVFADEDWGFLAQQSLEKLLKALLVLHGQEPPRSHSLQRLLQELLGHSDVKTTMIYTHVLNRGPAGVTSPADLL